MPLVVAQSGETIDALVWRIMGTIAGSVETALGLNPHLLDAVLLDEGDQVMLPDLAQTGTAVRHMVKLWD